MGLFNFFSKKTGLEVVNDSPASEPQSNYESSKTNIVYGFQYPIIQKRFDGEKTLGELGVVLDSIPDYKRLSLRSYDAYLKTDTVKILTSKHVDWTIGTGLKLQSEPEKFILESEGINIDFAAFQKTVEARFSLYANTKYCDYSRKSNLHELADSFFKAKFLSGDVLVICRIEKEGPNAQFISGSHVKDPYPEHFEAAKAKGNYIKHGIEFDKRGEHVAYYVFTESNENELGKFERIEAKGKTTGRCMAWMIYGEKVSPDHVRGIPEIAQVIEKVNKLDRYTEASVSKAEQSANIPFTIEHDHTSTGENPLDKALQEKFKVLGEVQDGYSLADGLANRITETTSNTVYNLPVGAKMKGFQHGSDMNYESFERANFNKIAAAANVPSEVALQMYNSNYSASRAAINGWGYIVDIDRNQFANDFYIPFFKLWLEVEILKNKINAPGYVSALNSGDFMIIEAYSKCRFIGKNMPHIDPLKEVKAVQLMLELNLISYEQATEMLNLGDWDSNYQKFLEEDKKIVKPQTPDENVL